LTLAWLFVGAPALAQGAETTAEEQALELAEEGTQLAEREAELAKAEAEAEAEEHFLSFFGVALGVALTIIGAGYGISKIASTAVESMARQPEAAANMQMVVIITTAMIEGIAFLALIICLLEIFN
jgi:F-type H+-transporting ATPase subunit c